jgi:hypothetical protein
MHGVELPARTVGKTDSRSAAAMVWVLSVRCGRIVDNPRDMAAYRRLYYNRPHGIGTISELIAGSAWSGSLTGGSLAPSMRLVDILTRRLPYW